MTRWISRRIVCGPFLRTGLFALALLQAACGRGGDDLASPVSGRVTLPLAGALVYIYQEGDDLFGPPRLVSGATADDGAFELALRPGRYLAVVRKRATGESAGPVQIGDYRSDPVSFEVSAGLPVRLDLLAAVKASNEKAFPTPEAAGGTAIAGTVVDADGVPVEGVRIHVYDHIQMSERPKYVSAKTGPDGRFNIPVKRGGTYYLAARDRFGGPPQVGDLFGRYDEGTIDPSGIVVRKDEVVGGIQIVVHKVW